MRPDVSVLLVTRNGMATLPAVLDAVRAQQTAWTRELVAIDSSSTDGTADLLRRRTDRVLTIDAATFNHGTTRNVGLRECRGAFVVLLVQDAVPASPGWLDALVAPLLGNERLAGTFARQEPRADASPIARRYVRQWIAAKPDPHVSFVPSPEAYDALLPYERFQACVFDNVCSCIRRSVWQQIPFAEVPIAEDLQWSRDVLLAGYGVAYVPEAVVLHSHDRGARYELMRTYLVHERLRRLFGLSTIPTLGSLARAWAATSRAHLQWTIADSNGGPSAGSLVHALALALALPLGQYLGARAADTGRRFLAPRDV